MRRALYLAGILSLLTVAAVWPATPRAATIPFAPVGITAIALDGEAGVAWQPVQDATSYEVYRATTLGGAGTLVSPAGLSQTRFTDASAANGTTYFYSVRAVSDAGASDQSERAQATPRARTCTSSHAIVDENCFPGTDGLEDAPPPAPRIPTASRASPRRRASNAGGSVDLRIESGRGTSRTASRSTAPATTAATRAA